MRRGTSRELKHPKYRLKMCSFSYCTCNLSKFNVATAIHSFSCGGGGQSWAPVKSSLTRRSRASRYSNVFLHTSTQNGRRRPTLQWPAHDQAKLCTRTYTQYNCLYCMVHLSRETKSWGKLVIFSSYETWYWAWETRQSCGNLCLTGTVVYCRCYCFCTFLEVTSTDNVQYISWSEHCTHSRYITWYTWHILVRKKKLAFIKY